MRGCGVSALVTEVKNLTKVEDYYHNIVRRLLGCVALDLCRTSARRLFPANCTYLKPAAWFKETGREDERWAWPEQHFTMELEPNERERERKGGADHLLHLHGAQNVHLCRATQELRA